MLKSQQSAKLKMYMCFSGLKYLEAETLITILIMRLGVLLHNLKILNIHQNESVY